MIALIAIWKIITSPRLQTVPTFAMTMTIRMTTMSTNPLSNPDSLRDFEHYEDDTDDEDPFCLGCGADTGVDYDGYCADCNEEGDD